MRAYLTMNPVADLPFRFSSAAGPTMIVALAYYAGAHVAFAVGTLTESFAPFWPPNTVLFCAFLLTPARRWPIYIAVAFPAHVAAELQGGMPWLQLLLAYVSNCAVASLSAFLLRRVAVGPPWLNTLRNTFVYLLVAPVVGPCLVAFLAALEPVLAGADGSEYWVFWWRWYLSNALGALTLAPLFLTWFGEGIRPLSLISTARPVEAAALGAALIATCLMAFEAARTGVGGIGAALLYVPVPVLLWAAVRFGRRGASGAILTVVVVAVWCAMEDRGPFVGGAPGQNVLALQLFLVVASAPLIVLAAVVEEIRSVNSRMARILAGISDCCFTLDRNWRVTAINAQAKTWFGASHELVSRGVLPSRSRSNALRKAMEKGVAAHIEQYSRGQQGRWIELHAYPSIDGLSVFFHDVTERKSAEQAIQEKEALLQSTMDALSAHVAIVDRHGTIVAVNAAWRHFAVESGHAGSGCGIGMNYFALREIIAPGCGETAGISAGIRRVLEDRCLEFRVDYPCRCGPAERWFQLRVTRFGAGARLRLVLVHEDVTEIKSAEASLRRLTERLLTLQDEERRRIARELHDSTSQNLLGAVLGMDQVLHRNPGLSAPARTALEESRGLVMQSQREIRTVSYLLHPPMLEECGIASALREYVRGFSKRSGIRVELDMAHDLARPGPEVERALFRVVQESLTNVHRHSGSPIARIRLYRTGGRIVLCVSDQGSGFAHAQAGAQAGLVHVGVGIAGMSARLEQLDGRLSIRSGQWGTVVRATVPIDVGRDIECLSLARA